MIRNDIDTHSQYLAWDSRGEYWRVWYTFFFHKFNSFLWCLLTFDRYLSFTSQGWEINIVWFLNFSSFLRNMIGFKKILLLRWFDFIAILYIHIRSLEKILEPLTHGVAVPEHYLFVIPPIILMDLKSVKDLECFSYVHITTAVHIIVKIIFALNLLHLS